MIIKNSADVREDYLQEQGLKNEPFEFLCIIINPEKEVLSRSIEP